MSTGDDPHGLTVHAEAHLRLNGLLLLLTLSGDLDLWGSDELARMSEEALSADRQSSDDLSGVTVVIDAADLSFIDCAGLGALIRLWRLTTGSGGSFSVIRAHPRTVRLLRVTGTDRVIPLRRDLAEAIEQHHRPSAT